MELQKTLTSQSNLEKDYILYYTNTEPLYCIPVSNTMRHVNSTSILKIKIKLIFFSFYGHICSIWTLPSLGLNRSYATATATLDPSCI